MLLITEKVCTLALDLHLKYMNTVECPMRMVYVNNPYQFTENNVIMPNYVNDFNIWDVLQVIMI